MRWKIEDTPEQAAFREKFLTWLSENLPDGWMKAIDEGDESGLREARSKWDIYRWQRTIGESGYAAPLWPKEYGGLSGEVWTQTIIREELSHYRLPLAGVNILGVGLAGPTLIEHGSEEQKQRYLRKILAADEIWCQLFSEPGAGSDLASLATRAVRQDGGWKVNGQKVWTSIAQFAHFGMLAARTNPDAPKHEGITYFILDMSSEGVEARPLRQMTGSSEFNEVYLTDVFVPDGNVIGEVDDGWKVCRTTLMNERVALAGLSVSPETFSGGMRRDPWLTFLETITDRQSPMNRQALAQIYVEQEVKEMTAFRAASARRRGESPGAEGGVGKVFNAELNQQRSNFAMNAAGAAAIAWTRGDTVAEGRAHAFLRARGYTIEGGSSEVLRNQIGERILGLPRDPEVDKGVPWKDIRRS